MLSRHGSRYPTLGANVYDLGQKLAKSKGQFKASSSLGFLEDWEYQMGHEILVPKGAFCSFLIRCCSNFIFADILPFPRCSPGRQELFDSGQSDKLCIPRAQHNIADTRLRHCALVYVLQPL